MEALVEIDPQVEQVLALWGSGVTAKRDSAAMHRVEAIGESIQVDSTFLAESALSTDDRAGACQRPVVDLAEGRVGGGDASQECKVRRTRRGRGEPRIERLVFVEPNPGCDGLDRHRPGAPT